MEIKLNPFHLFLLFLLLKLTGVIAWSWWWVTAPLWIIPAFVVLCIVSAICLALVLALIALIAGITGR